MEEVKFRNAYMVHWVSANTFYVYQQYAYIVLILQCRKVKNNCQIVWTSRNGRSFQSCPLPRKLILILKGKPYVNHSIFIGLAKGIVTSSIQLNIVRYLQNMSFLIQYLRQIETNGPNSSYNCGKIGFPQEIPCLTLLLVFFFLFIVLRFLNFE
jgi:hypothetical protein